MSTVIAADAVAFPITDFMNALVELEESVHDDLVVYRWRPLNIQTPAVYNWIPGGPHTQFAVDTEKDMITVLARIAIQHSDSDQEMAMIESYAASFINRIDPALKRIRPLRTQPVKRAWRANFRLVEDRFNDIPYLAAEFPIEIEMMRTVYANS